MEAEGILFKTSVHLGVGPDDETLFNNFDAVVLCTGATRPRELDIPGRDLAGIHQAIPFLKGQNQLLAGEIESLPIPAEGLDVIVIGGGDTGSDCIGTCHRQGAASVTNFELLPRPGEGRPESTPWPYWPMRLRTSSSHEEGGERCWGLLTKRFIGEGGRLTAVETAEVRWTNEKGRPATFEVIAGSERRWPADLVILAMGFSGPETDTLVSRLNLEVDARGSLGTRNYQTTNPKIFAAGDARRGQSLIVWALSEGREAARAVDRHLMGKSALPEKPCCDLPRG
jgi:glutamate synthase (NADPH/NADH) small chain